MNSNITTAVRRHAGRRDLGEHVTVRNYEFGDEDRVGDGAHGDTDSGRIDRAGSPYENVPASVRSTGDSTTERDSAASRPSTDLRVYLPDTHDAVENLAGGPDAAPRSHIERSSGQVLAVRLVVPQSNGLVEATAEVIE